MSDAVAMRTMGHADTRILARYQDVVSELQRDAALRMDCCSEADMMSDLAAPPCRQRRRLSGSGSAGWLGVVANGETLGERLSGMDASGPTRGDLADR